MQELIDLSMGLLAKPSSRLQAALGGWDHPVSREAMILMELFDLQHSSKSKRKPKPYPRPWPASKKKYGGKSAIKRSAADVGALLRPDK